MEFGDVRTIRTSGVGPGLGIRDGPVLWQRRLNRQRELLEIAAESNLEPDSLISVDLAL